MFLTFFTFSCHGQETKSNTATLSISPIIDKTEPSNKLIISTLSEFLKTKNNSLTENKHWLRSDFHKYQYPYFDIYNIENSKHGKDFFKPTLMEIIPTRNDSQKIVKIAFIGHVPNTKENQIKSIYNLIANISHHEVKFSRYLDYATENWQTFTMDSLTYKISPNKNINKTEIEKQKKDIDKIRELFNAKPIHITYYSCIDPKEIFEIKGFDYNPMMHIDKTGGLADYGNIIFSGNHSELYTHEAVHIYTNHLFSNMDKFLDEGIATYIAGSGKFDYEWHRKKLDAFLVQNPDFNFVKHTDTYERLYFESETPIPYLTAALICERTKRMYGKDRLIALLKSENELWTNLNTTGLTKENINEELRKELKLPITKAWETIH
jgi:hypothetical protein